MIRNITLTLGLCWLCLAAGAQQQHRTAPERLGKGITVHQAKVDAKDKTVTVKFGLAVPRSSVKRNFRYTLTPNLRNTVGRGLLTPVAIVGRRKGMSERRHAALAGRKVPPIKMIKTTTGEGIRYAVTIPYERWMAAEPVSLYLGKMMQNYHRTFFSEEELLLSGINIEAPWKIYTPQLDRIATIPGVADSLAALNPALRPSSMYASDKASRNLLQELSDAMKITFRSGSDVIDPTLDDNGAKLARMTELLTMIMNDKLSRVDHIRIVGQAVADGDNLLETALSVHRARAVEAYLTAQTGLPASTFDVASPEKMWQSLRAMVVASNMDEKEKKEVLDIIDRTPDLAQREAKLMAANGGVQYWYMKEKMLTTLQDAAYTNIYYSGVADANLAIINQAIDLINEGRYEEALALLNGLAGDPRADNLAGVCRMMSDDAVRELLYQHVRLGVDGAMFTMTMDEVTRELSTSELLNQQESFVSSYDQYLIDSKNKDFKRDSSGLAVQFRVGQSNILTKFNGNTATLERIVAAIHAIKTDDKANLMKIRIVGQASPEGTYALNARLSVERAEALKNYITANTPLSNDIFDLVSIGPAWDELRDMVAASDMEYKDQVVDIIDRVPVSGGRDSMLYNLKWGGPYLYMKEHMFPKLRNATYIKIYYDGIVDDNLLVVNRAIALIGQGKYGEALPLLEAIKYDPRATAPLGVCLMMTGQSERAKEFFQQASAARGLDAKTPEASAEPQETYQIK